MTTLLVPGSVQIWTKKNGLTKSKGAYIEIVEEDEKVRMVIHFSTEDSIKDFPLTNNVREVGYRFDEEGQNHLHITFQNNSFLYIGQLAYSDAVQLKSILDRVPKKEDPPSAGPPQDTGSSSGTTAQEETLTSAQRRGGDSQSGSLAAALERELSSLLAACLLNAHTVSSERRRGKSKKKSRYIKEATMYRYLLIKKLSVHPVKYVTLHLEKPLVFKGFRQDAKLKFSVQFDPSSGESSAPDKTQQMRIVSFSNLLSHLFEPTYQQDSLEPWEETELCFAFCPDKQWQGFPNTGNTCYMNVVLQTVFCIPSFCDDLLSQTLQWGKVPFNDLSLCCAQLLLLRNICNFNIKDKILENMKRIISTISSTFSTDAQNDAHEFLGHCFQHMKESLNKIQLVLEASCEAETGSVPQCAVPEALVCPITTNFEVELQYSFICEGCNHIVIKPEVSNYLSINLPREKVKKEFCIQSSLDLYFQPEEIDYRCEMCNYKGSIATYAFKKLPRVLIIHLKRYNYCDNWFLNKDHQVVLIPKYIDLGSHCDENTQLPTPLGNSVHIWDSEAEVLPEVVTKGISEPPTPPVNLPSDMDSLFKYLVSPKLIAKLRAQSEMEERARRQQQGKDLAKGPQPGIRDPEMGSSGLKAASEEQLPKGSSAKHKKCKSKSHVLARLQQAYNPVKYKEMGTKSGNGRTPEEPHKASVVSPRDSEEARFSWPQKTSSPHLETPLAQGHTEKLSRPVEVSCQAAKVESHDESCSSQNAGKQATSATDDEDEHVRAEREKQVSGPFAYQLFGMISHVGDNLQSGHYVNDAYDFEKKEWFTYSDLKISVLTKDPKMIAIRPLGGYIFFYMQKDVFEELEKRAEDSQSSSTEAAGDASQKE
ncbi:ubiquitin carboxyl-terminal hydrolase 26 [Echinops telfairi]|uniref:Ubiquitin carboxyl-terminal hydrolase n=1 Tax=Echinops telfairi TaxID=9371 RepID=A0ABM0ZTG0_ECHTE|nr:ubiquitin carboxyl-terminal hydrolase 26 [Echinops telfairi]